MRDPKKENFMQHKMPVKSSLVFQYAVLYFSFVILGVIVTMIFAVFLPKGVVSLNGYVVLYIIGIILGLMSCKIFLTAAKKSGDKFCKLELSEGYTDETLSEAYKLFNRSEKNLWKMSYAGLIGNIHNFRGEFGKTAELLSQMDDSLFSAYPTNAQLYYSTLLMAYLMLGERDRAVYIYNRGSCFMYTYMNSPVSGAYVSLSLAVYEYYAGRFDESLKLLDASLENVKSGAKPQQRVPIECLVSIINYWKAVVLKQKGRREEAFEIIEKCKRLYKTPYYEMLFAKLLEDMANDDNRKNEVKNETIS